MTCESHVSPNAKDGESKWIRYDLGHVYHLGESWIWNINAIDLLDKGVDEYEVAISVNNVVWKKLGTYSLPMATGSSLYSGDQGPDLEGQHARYILLTLKNNHSNTGCIGFGEIRFETRGSVDEAELNTPDIATYPNPASDYLNLECFECESNVSYTLYSLQGQYIESGQFFAKYQLELSGLSAGMYVMVFETAFSQSRKKFSVFRE